MAILGPAVTDTFRSSAAVTAVRKTSNFKLVLIINNIALTLQTSLIENLHHESASTYPELKACATVVPIHVKDGSLKERAQ